MADQESGGMNRGLRALLGAVGVAIVALIGHVTPQVSGSTRAVLGLLAAVCVVSCDVATQPPDLGE